MVDTKWFRESYLFQNVISLKTNHILGLLYCVACTLILVLGVQGFEHGRSNNFRDQSIQLPIIYSYADPSLFPNDFLMKTRDSYVTWFYPAIGYISRYVSLEYLMLGLYVLSVLLTVSAVYVLAETLFPERHVGLFAVILWMAYLPNPGGDFIHSPFVTHSTFAIALALWAVVLILRRQHIGAALLLGAIANINAMTSMFVTFMWMVALILDYRRWAWKLLILPIIMGIMALPILIWRFSLPLVEASLDQFVAIVRLRLWYAVFPFSISIILWVGFFTLCGVWVYSFRYGKSQYHSTVLRLVSGIVALSLVATIFSEIIPIEFVIELQLIRSTWLINLFIILYLASMIHAMLSSPNHKETLIAFILVASLAIPRLIIARFPVLHPTPYVLYATLRSTWIQPHFNMIIVVIMVSLAGILYIAWRMFRQESNSIQLVKRSRLLVWFTFAVFCFVSPLFVESRVMNEQESTTDDWDDTLSWVKNHTPVDAYFLIPPTLDGFRVVAKRSHLGNWKDGTVGIFNNGWAIEWYHLMIELGFDEETFSFQPLNQDQLCEVTIKHNVDYAVVYQSWEIDGEAIYQNSTFIIFPSDKLSC